MSKYFARIMQVLGIWCLFCLSGCMVGPNFHKPRTPINASYTSTPLPNKTARTPSLKQAGKSQEFIENLDIPREWWRLFHSPCLDRLVQLSIENSPNIASAQAAVKQAQENLIAQIGASFWPSINGNITAERQRFPAATIGGANNANIFNLFNVTANVSYNLDLFGGARRLVEALDAQADYQRYLLVATYLTLTANVVTTAVSIASIEAQIAATKDLIRAEDDILNILQQQFRLGGIARTNVLTQTTFVEQTRATLPPLEKSLAQTKHALCVLLGLSPGCKLPKIDLNELNLPKHIPVMLPSRLVCKRPDIQAAEALLHAASAQIGVATANLFPQITLSADYGWTALNPQALFGNSSKTWNMAASILQPIFNGGALLAQRRAAKQYT